MKVLFKQTGGLLNEYVPVTFARDSNDKTILTGGQGDKDDLSLKSILDLAKSLDGLPSDVNYFTRQIQNFFYSPLLQQNTSALSSMYLNMISRANLFKFSKELFGNTKTEITNKGGLNEIAINPQGQVYVTDENGEIALVSPEQYYRNRDSFAPVTNDDLLNMRAYDSPMKDEILTVVNNGTGMKDVTNRINTMINTLGNTELKESNLTQRLKNGFVLLTEIANAGGLEVVDGKIQFKTELLTKDQQAQIMHALSYVYDNLTNSEKTLLITKTGSEEAARNYILNLYYSKQSVTTSITNEPFTGKLGDGSGSSSDDDKIKSNPLVRIFMGEGGLSGKYTVVTKDDDKGFSVDAVHYGKVPNIDDDCSLNEFLTKSGIDQGMVYRGRDITFGDQELSMLDLDDVMYDNQGISVVSLPAIMTQDGNKKVDFGVIDLYREACEDFKKKTGLANYNLIKTKEQLETWLQVLRQHDLYKYAYTDENGNFDDSVFGVFIVADAYMTDKNMKVNKDSKFIEEVTDRLTLKRLESKLQNGLSNNSESEQNNDNKYNYKLDTRDKPGIVEWWGDKVYKGTVFIPIGNNLSAAYYDSYQMTMDLAGQLESLYQQAQKRSNQNSNSSDLLNP